MIRPLGLLVMLLVFSEAVLAAERPNVVLVMADDMGWGDVSYYGHSHIKTPHLDRMAAEGVRFDRFYAAAPVCSPTRGSVLTGRHPQRYGIAFANTGHMKAAEITLAEVLKEHGYTTGHFGKWHLGTLTTKIRESNRARPGAVEHYAPPWEHGFDVCCSTEAKTPTWWDEGAYEKYGTHYWTGPEQMLEAEKVVGDDSRVIVDHAVPFIESAAKSGRPFFAVVWFHTPHKPIEAGPKYLKMYDGLGGNEAEYYGSITAMDEQIGRLRRTLDEQGVAANTMLWFCSDNGPENGTPGVARADLDGPGGREPIHLRGRKRSLHEGGVRVPGLLVWPEKIKQPRIVTTPCVTSDYFPTVLDVLGHRLSEDKRRPYDGISLVPLIEGRTTERPQPIGFASRDQQALTAARYKIYRKGRGPWSLYDVLVDPEESNDVASKNPDVVEQMSDTFQRWYASCRASDKGGDY